MPAAPAGIIKSCVMPPGKNLQLIKDQCSDFHHFFFWDDRKNELDSDLYDKT